MGLETATYINQLVATNPTGADPKLQGDDHIRLTKSVLQATLPNLAGAMTASHTELNILDGATLSTAELNVLDGVTASTAELNILDGATLDTTELNYVNGVTSPIQTQIDTEVARATAAEALLAPLVSPALTGVPTAPTAAPGTNTTQIATMAALQQAAFSAALPSQAGQAGNFLTTDGTNASWTQSPNQIVYLAKTANYTVLLSDRADLLDASNTITLALTAAATLGSGWFIYVRNSGTGLVTIDPNGAETIDGAASIAIQPKEVRLIQCDGTTFRTIRIDYGTGGYIHVHDQKASGVAGGTSLAATAQNRTLQTTITNTIEGASLATNLVTLPAGTYRASGYAPVNSGGGSRLYIYNNTDATYLLAGTQIGGSGTNVVEGQFTITASKAIALRHYITSALVTSGLGDAVNDTRPEIFAILIIEKVA